MDEHDSPGLPPRVAPGAAGGVVVAGRYRVERLIARGGMAAVFLAEHIALRRRVALKILHPPPDAEESGNFEKRFRLEAETLATLDHPNIVTLYDYGEAEDGRFYLAMEYIEGPRFTDILGHGALAPDRAIRLILEVCAGLRYAHKRGVIHRDLKPSNLLIGTDSEGGERVKVVDFGLVKVAEIDQFLTREGLVLGSPHCMAPEQVRGGDIDQRADIYAIGVLLFRSLTGVYPFHGATSTATMVAHLNEPIPTFASVAPELRVPARLEDVVRRCLAKRQADRYPDVKALMEDLKICIGMRAEDDTTSRSFSGSLPSQTEPTDPTAPAAKPRTKARSLLQRWPLVLLGLVVLLSLSSVAYLVGQQDSRSVPGPEVPMGASASGVAVGGAPVAVEPVAAPLPEPVSPTPPTGTGEDVQPVGEAPAPPVTAKNQGTPPPGDKPPPKDMSRRRKVTNPDGTTSTTPGTVVESPTNGAYMGLDEFDKQAGDKPK
ncbi:MAG: serine/threonine-protein kinase [Myxococcota bacterium]